MIMKIECAECEELLVSLEKDIILEETVSEYEQMVSCQCTESGSLVIKLLD